MDLFESLLQPESILSLSTKVLSPPNERTAFINAAISGINYPSEAWESLIAQDIIPTTWAAHENRRFSWFDQTAEMLPHPHSLRAVVTIASNISGILAAEEIAKEFASALRPWGYRSPGKILWRIGTPVFPGYFYETWWHRMLDRVVVYPAEVAAEFNTRIGQVPWGRLQSDMRACLRNINVWNVFGRLERDFQQAFQWQTAVAYRRPAPNLDTYNSPAGLYVGTPYDECPNPFLPLINLWYQGYALHRLTKHYIVLAAREYESDRLS